MRSHMRRKPEYSISNPSAVSTAAMSSRGKV
jgi:hypothetical protein